MINNNTRILIVEDEVLIAEYIKDLLEDEGFSSVTMAHEPDEALLLFSSFLPEIILLDINLGSAHAGIELSRQKNRDAAVIFLTAQHDGATIRKALETNPESYLTKPIKKADLFAAVYLALKNKQLAFVTIKDGYDTVKLNIDDILYVKSDNVYIDIFTTKRKYTVRQTLEKFSAQLNSPWFFRSHRSYLINHKAVERVSSKSVFIGNTELPLSRSVAADLDFFKT